MVRDSRGRRDAWINDLLNELASCSALVSEEPKGEKPKQVTSYESRGSGVAFSCKSPAAAAAAAAKASLMTRSRENNKVSFLNLLGYMAERGPSNWRNNNSFSPLLRRVELYGCCTYEIYYGAWTEKTPYLLTDFIVCVCCRPRPLRRNAVTASPAKRSSQLVLRPTFCHPPPLHKVAVTRDAL
uniref:Uncharacterized protein n=1 Tax=Trichogramma kaykai TaxID=54128 RepID=A0ABD2VY49_9HYME